jgi:outer membrane protein assembly factor BamB
MIASVAMIPNASAHTPAWQIPTFAYVQPVPNPVGVGQLATIYMWVNQIPDGASLENNIRFQNYQITITAPDGTTIKQTFPVVSDTTSNQGYSFTPSQVGTYKLNFTFPGYTYTYTGLLASPFGGPPAQSQYLGDTYMPSSASATLTVQQAPIAVIPNTPLPTSYWTRPIYGENPYWFAISSNWLGSPWGTNQGYGSEFPGDAVGPQTAHVMWTKPIQGGGVIGGNSFVNVGDTYFDGSAYNQRFTNPIIIDGMLYYTEPISFAGASSGPTDCVNLQTGQLIWSRTDVPALDFGYIYDVQDPNQHGGYPPILISVSPPPFIGYSANSEWRAFDAYTGDPIFNITNVPAGTSAIGENGEYLILSLANYGPTTMTPFGPVPSGPAIWYLQEWNSSRLWDNTYSGPSTSPPVIPPITNGNNPSLLDFNVSMTSLDSQPGTPSIQEAFCNNELIGTIGTLPAGSSIFGGGSWAPYSYFGVNLNASKGTIGSVMWTKTYNAPAGNITVEWGGADASAGVFVEQYKETSQFVGYSMKTGEKLWGPTGGQAALDYYNFGYNAGGNEEGTILADGKLYSGGFSGIIYCYDLTNGNLLWTYGNGGVGNSTSSGFEVPGNYPTSIYAIGNGIIYTTTTEHTVETPIYKGALVRAINATTGKEIWTLSAVTSESGPPGTGAIADGYTTILNGYDNQIYSIGRGPSATTVTAPNIGVTTATPITITGTVTDVAAGTKQTEQAADFPYGVPCASDASMTAWMGYVYQQQPEPTNFTGVKVQLAVLDSNGNHYPIGYATTDESGTYSLTWTPNITGNYTVFASFAGTNGYWPSSAETHVYAGAPAATTAPTATPLSGLSTQSALEYGVAAIIIVIIIIGAVLAILVTRKRP